MKVTKSDRNNLSKREEYYVYHLIDPRDGSVFYVGKGIRTRLFDHERDAFNLIFANSKKEQRIHEIWANGLEVERRIVKWFKGEDAAFSYEKLEIARIGMDKLTNLSRGGEGESVKAIARAKQFINHMEALARTSHGKKLESVKMIIREMHENIQIISDSVKGEKRCLLQNKKSSLSALLTE